MDLIGTKSVFRVIDKVRLKTVSSAKETSLKIKISIVACLDMIISKQNNYKVTDQSAQAGLRLCCSLTPKDRFSHVKAHI